MHCTQELKEQLHAANPAAAPKRTRKAPHPAAPAAATSKPSRGGSASDDAADDEDAEDESGHEEDCAAAANLVRAEAETPCPPAPKKVCSLHASDTMDALPP